MFDVLFDKILPVIISGIFIYFFLIIVTCIMTFIRVKKADKTTEICMTKAGVIIYAISLILYIAYIIYCIYDFTQRLGTKGFLSALNAFNILAVVTMLYSMVFQDFLFVSKRAVIRGNHLYEYRRIKKVTYPKKHKMAFVYGQNELHFSLWFVDTTKLKKHLVK